MQDHAQENTEEFERSLTAFALIWSEQDKKIERDINSSYSTDDSD